MATRNRQRALLERTASSSNEQYLKSKCQNTPLAAADPRYKVAVDMRSRLGYAAFHTGVPPTERKARTGELTPPTRTFSARLK